MSGTPSLWRLWTMYKKLLVEDGMSRLDQVLAQAAFYSGARCASLGCWITLWRTASSRSCSGSSVGTGAPFESCRAQRPASGGTEWGDARTRNETA